MEVESVATSEMMGGRLSSQAVTLFVTAGNKKASNSAETRVLTGF